MSMSRQKRKQRLIDHMASLGYVYCNTQARDRTFLHLSSAHGVPLRFKLDPLLEPLVEQFALSRWKLKKHELDWSQIIKLQFSSRKELSKWLHITGKILEDELLGKIAKA